MVSYSTGWSFLEPLIYKKEFKHLAEISKELHSPHATVRQYLNSFEKKGVVFKQIKGRMTMYKLQVLNPLIINYLSVIEKEKLTNLAEKDLVLKEIVHFLYANTSGKVIIFGSSVNNTTKADDIDVIIAGEIDSKVVKEFEKKFGVKFHIILLEDLTEVSETLKEEIINKHLIIQDCEEVIKWMLKN